MNTLPPSTSEAIARLVALGKTNYCQLVNLRNPSNPVI